MANILLVFVVAFFSISVIALAVSIFRGKDEALAKSCRGASRMAFFIGLILLYLYFVFSYN